MTKKNVKELLSLLNELKEECQDMSYGKKDYDRGFNEGKVCGYISAISLIEEKLMNN